MGSCRVHRVGGFWIGDLAPRLSQLSTTLLSDSRERTGAIAPGLLLSLGLTDGIMVGQALTVVTAAGDNLAVHQALELLEPGHVLVVAAGGSTERAIVGEIMCSYAKGRGCAGMVIDGSVRDAHALGSLGLPVFARGVSHLGPYKNGPGEIGGAVAVGGVVVESGDAIIGDADGVVVIPRERASAVTAAAELRQANERGVLQAIADHRYRPDWLEAAIELIACE